MSLIKMYLAGGIFMHFILLVGFVAAAIIVERALALYKNYQAAPIDLRHKLMTFISLGQFNEAMAYVERSAGKAAMGRVAMTGLQSRKAGGGDEEVQARMDEVLTNEISSIDKRTGFLAVYGNVATLLGLLGTVTGLIASFMSVTNANPAERSLLLGQGIAEALNTTAFGLIIAIPALVAYAIYQNRTDSIITEMTETSSKIFHDILFRSESQTQTTAGRAMNANTEAATGFHKGN